MDTFGREDEQFYSDQFELALEDIVTALGNVHRATDAALPESLPVATEVLRRIAPRGPSAIERRAAPGPSAAV